VRSPCMTLSRILSNDTKSGRIRPHRTALAVVQKSRAEIPYDLCTQRDAPVFNEMELVGAVGIERSVPNPPSH